MTSLALELRKTMAYIEKQTRGTTDNDYLKHLSGRKILQTHFSLSSYTRNGYLQEIARHFAALKQCLEEGKLLHFIVLANKLAYSDAHLITSNTQKKLAEHMLRIAHVIFGEANVESHLRSLTTLITSADTHQVPAARKQLAHEYYTLSELFTKQTPSQSIVSLSDTLNIVFLNLMRVMRNSSIFPMLKPEPTAQEKAAKAKTESDTMITKLQKLGKQYLGTQDFFPPPAERLTRTPTTTVFSTPPKTELATQAAVDATTSLPTYQGVY